MIILHSPREIALMREAGLLVWECFQLVRSMITPGVSTGEIDAAVTKFFAQHNAKPLFLGYPNSTAGAPPFPACTCISVNREVVHGIPSPKRKLKEGDIVSIDTGCRLAGWCGDAAATFPVGKVAAEVSRLLDATKGVLQLAIDLMREREWWSDVAKEMERYIKREGFSVVEGFVGHGIGKDMHEEPQVPNFSKKKYPRSKDDFRLETGLVIAIEPMVNVGTKETRTLPDQWTQVTVDGRPSAHFEHTVAVTENGPTVLTCGPNGETW